MARPLGNARTPYVVRGRYEWSGEPVTEWDCTSHVRLSTALQHVRDVTTAWLRLVGGQQQPLSWHVIDVRDYSEYRPGIASKFGETDGTDEAGRNYARREHGARNGGKLAGSGGRVRAAAGGARRRTAAG